ncbi:MAG: hypothetical protein LBP40_07740 [Campylobacteraceae bacterium]|jgi:succinate-acetate transporter protein|nr:hypothetical protein [Campylobacteraceae bacterium]
MQNSSNIAKITSIQADPSVFLGCFIQLIAGILNYKKAKYPSVVWLLLVMVCFE